MTEREEERERMERRLHSSNEPEVWAEEFCKLFDNYVVSEAPTNLAQSLDPGTMVGWFANAMETAAFFDRTKRPYQEQPPTDWEME